jgi:hypothetical protein
MPRVQSLKKKSAKYRPVSDLALRMAVAGAYFASFEVAQTVGKKGSFALLDFERSS